MFLQRITCLYDYYGTYENYYKIADTKFHIKFRNIF